MRLPATFTPSIYPLESEKTLIMNAELATALVKFATALAVPALVLNIE